MYYRIRKVLVQRQATGFTSVNGFWHSRWGWRSHRLHLSENICRCPEGSGAWLPQAECLIASLPFLGTLAPKNTSFSGLYGIRVGLEVGTCVTVVECGSKAQILPQSVSIAP